MASLEGSAIKDLNGIALGVAASVFGLAVVAAYLYQRSIEEEAFRSKQLAAESQLNQSANSLAQAMNVRLNLTSTLAAFVSTHRDFSAEEFDRFGSELQKNLEGVRSLQLAPKGIVTYVTQLEDNQAALGHDLLGDPKRREIALRAIEGKRFIVAGPIKLLQGGEAIIARRPLFFPNESGDMSGKELGKEEFWGFATVLIDLEPLYRDARIHDIENDYVVALRGKDGLGEAGDVFYGDPDVFQNVVATATVNLPNARWQMGVKSRSDASAPLTQTALFWIVLVALSFIPAFTAYIIAARPRTLKRLIDERTKELREAVRKAENASKLKETFLSNMSHEIRTPLNGIVGAIDILKAKERSEDDARFLDIVKNASEELLRLIDDILDMSKIERDELVLSVSTFNLREELSSVESLMRLVCTKNGNQLEFILPDSQDLWVRGDIGRIRQIMINLMNNAAKFTRDGLISVHANVETRSQDSLLLTCNVSDTGKGIPEELQQRIFEKFVRADSQAEGSGLGLSICKRLVELMGGNISMKSVEGEGSTFEFSVPMAKVIQNTLIRRRQDNRRRETGTTIRVRKNLKKILVAEDNPVNRLIAARHLQSLYPDSEILEAESGTIAVDKVKEHQPDLVLMDCQMPEMDGFEATAAVRGLQAPLKDVPIIALTANAMSEDRQRCLDAGMDEYISKPFKAADLQQVINTVFKNKNAI